MSSFSHGLIQSFRAAGRGFVVAFREERVFRVLVAAALIVMVLLATLPLASWERVTLLLLIGAVLVLELLNSMTERFVDLLKPRLSAYVAEVKELMAAAVLMASLFAALAALLILGPHATLLLRQF